MGLRQIEEGISYAFYNDQKIDQEEMGRILSLKDPLGPFNAVSIGSRFTTPEKSRLVRLRNEIQTGQIQATPEAVGALDNFLLSHQAAGWSPIVWSTVALGGAAALFGKVVGVFFGNFCVLIFGRFALIPIGSFSNFVAFQTGLGGAAAGALMAGAYHLLND